MPEPVVRFRGVNKNFGRAAALRAIEFDVLPGRSMGLAGLNGAGKTTLIKCLLDFCGLDSGSISIEGIDHRRPRARLGLTYLPERFIAPYFLTGREFLAMMLRLLGSAYEEDRVREMLLALDLSVSALEKPVRAYSKGMAQKLGLAACFLSDRNVLVLDEPMSGLDAKARARVKTLLLKLKSAGRTLFFTSHSLDDIQEICDDVSVLHEGSLAFSGPIPELCNRHAQPSLERAFLECVENHA